MNIAIVGTGYVGLVTGVCFSRTHNVFCIDTNEEKIKKLNNNELPIYEPGLEEILLENKERLTFTTSLEEALKECDICFIAVGTPMGEDGSADLKYVLAVAKSIGKCMTHHMYIVDKSTVPVGTADKVRTVVQEQLDERKSELTFDVISNPEFLKEGSAIEDVTYPDRVVIGTDNEAAKDKMSELYSNVKNIFYMDIHSAEMTKYAANSMLATKISFINEISNICEKVGADVNKVREGIAADRRIGPMFINPGCGYGGSCFPKDVQALIKTSKDFGYTPKILDAVELVNAEQKKVLPNKIISKFGNNLTGKTFAVWGLAFKPNTDDMRESPAIELITTLTSLGATIKCYDPKAMEEAKKCYLKDLLVVYCNDKFEAAKSADALVIITDWDEFSPYKTDYNALKYILKNPIIFDGRNIFDKYSKVVDNGENSLNAMKNFEYYQIGVKN